MKIREPVVVICKVSGKPITISIQDSLTRLEMPLSDFLDEVAKAMGNPALLVSNAALKARLLKASEVVRLQAQKNVLEALGQ